MTGPGTSDRPAAAPTGERVAAVPVTQDGADNYSSVIQSGSGSSATVTQTTDLNNSWVNQSGNGHSATVVQGSTGAM